MKDNQKAEANQQIKQNKSKLSGKRTSRQTPKLNCTAVTLSGDEAQDQTLGFLVLHVVST